MTIARALRRCAATALSCFWWWWTWMFFVCRGICTLLLRLLALRVAFTGAVVRQATAANSEAAVLGVGRGQWAEEGAVEDAG